MEIFNKRSKRGIIYTLLSFDDTHYLNLKCAKLLEKYHLKGTFYFDVARISKHIAKDIKWISQWNEIGSHGMTHRNLTKLQPHELRYELEVSKRMLEKIIEKPINSFAYPYGYFNSDIIEAVRSYGYSNARSFVQGNSKIDSELFALRVTLSATSYGYRQIPFFIKSLGLYKLGYNPWMIRRWDKLVEYILEKLSRSAMKGEERVFHLVVHADFMELRNDWDKLEEVFNIVSSSKLLRNITVTEYAKICKKLKGGK